MSEGGGRERITLFRPILREEAIRGVEEVLRSGWLGAGPKTAAFEKAFASYVGAPYCVAVNSCTSALHLGLHLLDLPAGSEVITTPLTFVSPNQAILYEKCRPVFADIQRRTGNLDVRSVEKLIGEKTGAILIVHYGGYPCDLDEFYALAGKHGLPIVEDCAHACGATYKGKRIGSHGDIHAFSFHAVKNLPMGDGGAVTVRSAAYDERLRRLRWHGIEASTYRRWEGKGYHWDYGLSELGFKYQMNDIHAAIGLAQIPHVDEENACRARIAARYREELEGVPGLELLRRDGDRTTSHHLFPVLVEGRDRLVDKLRDAGVDVGVHYRRNDGYPIFDAYELPETEYFWRRVVSLPMHLGLGEEDVSFIAGRIRSGW